MNRQHRYRKKQACLILPLVLALAACSQEPQDSTTVESETKMFKPVTLEQPASDVIARVGDQAIHFSEVNTMLNSSAVVGLSIPALGTPERDVVRIALLDKIVSANLLYLDALDKGLDKDLEYQQAMQRFANGVLADLYFRQNIASDIPVSEEEIQAVYEESVVPGTEMTEGLRKVIETTVRKRKLAERQAQISNQLRTGIDITIYQNHISPAGDEERAADTLVADIDGEHITWGEVRDRLIASGKGAVLRDELAMEIEARIQALQAEIDTRILARKAREARLEQDPSYRLRVNEYRKTRLINLHRARLAASMEPTDAELESYYEAHRDEISMPEFRKVQMVMLESESQAAAVKSAIEAGNMSMYQAASEHSVAPDAKQNLGEIGWIAKGKLKPGLDAVVFDLGPGEIGGPVEAGGLWHLAAVLDIRDPQNEDLSSEATRVNTRRRYIHEKLDGYVVGLRQDRYEVDVYEDTITRLAQQEADMVRQLTERARDPASVTQQRIKEMQEIMQQSK